MSFANTLVDDINKIIVNSNLKNNKILINKGLKCCSRALKLISNAIKKSYGIAEKQNLSSCLAKISSFKQILEALEKNGFGLKSIKGAAKQRVKWDVIYSAFQSRIKTAVITNLSHTDVKLFLEECVDLFKRKIQKILLNAHALKINAVLCGEFQHTKNDEIRSEYKYLNTRNSAIYRETDVSTWFLRNIRDPLLVDLSEFQERDSGWALSRIINLTICINKFNPLRAGTFLELPSSIKQRQACVNIRNNDDMCFAWSIVSALYPTSDHSYRTSSYPHPKDVLNLRGIQFPMTLRQISRFEKQNDLSVNVYRLDKRLSKTFNVVPAYLTSNKQEKHINLLLIQDNYYNDENDLEDICLGVKYHFVWIKNLSRLLFKQLSKARMRKYICDRCLHYFHSEQNLNKHLQDCMLLNNGPIPKIPRETEKFIEFKNFQYKEEVPFVIYADTECLLVPIGEEEKCTTAQSYQRHVPFSMGYYVKCSYDDTLSFYRSYTGPDCVQWFVKELLDFAANVETVFLCDLPMESLSPEQISAFYNATQCHICEKAFNSTDKIVRDHNHITGKYRGPAHEDCNLNFRDSHVVPVFFHSMSSYDGHIIIKALTEVDGAIDVLPVNKETYISFTKHIPGNLIKFRFLDSFRFLPSSLDKLASYLPDYPIIKSEFKDITEEQFSLLCRKGVFPYDYMDGWSKLKETELPPKMEFYNRLEDSLITNAEYEHANNVWNLLGCRTMQEYSELYMKTDILLLADVFDQFCKTALETYGISPTHAYTLPGYAWQCMLYNLMRNDNIKLELLTDLNMVLLCEKGTRGGLSQCTKRFAEANNPYLPYYDSTKEDTYLMYYDVNNQYGWAMSQYLPYGGFKWLSDDEIMQLNICEIADDAETGYIFEVDLEIPRELHTTFSDLPPCPEHRVPPTSADCTRTKSDTDNKCKKLLGTLYDKYEYVIHYRNLKQALKLGVKLNKIHRVLSFKQAPWLKSYIDLNTKLRQSAKNEFEKNLFKLLNNAVFGKTMENIRKHSSVKLVTKWDGRYGAEALISRPEFKSVTIVNENMVIIELAKSELFFNKPIYAGMCILDLAKTTIYSFHYDYMLKKFPNCNVLYTDTDSLIYEIKNSDVYQTMKSDCHHFFDTSDYPEDNIYEIPLVNKKVLGMLKDENNGRIMTHFVGLRSKMYATKSFYSIEEINRDEVRLQEEGKEREEIEKYIRNKNITTKLKGIKKSVLKNKIVFDDYIDCLQTFTEKALCQNLIRSNKHDIYTIQQFKIGLSPYDDKRKIEKKSYTTLPWGHWSIMEED